MRRSSRLAIRGVPRQRRAISSAAPGSISTARRPADRFTIVCSSSTLYGSRRSTRPKRPRRGARTRTGADDKIHAEILQRGIEHLFYVRQQAVNLIDEKYLVLVDVAKNGAKVLLFLQHWPCGGAEPHLQLLADDGRQRGLAEAGRPVEQHVVHGLAAQSGRLDGDAEVLLQFGLSYEIGQTARAKAHFKLQIFGLAGAGNQFPVGHVLPAYRTNSSARRKSGSNSAEPPAALALRTAASAFWRAQPRSHRAEIGRASSRERVPAGVGGASPPPEGILSRSSSTMRSAVFLPMPGMRTSLSTSPRRMALMSSGAASPDRIVTASLGPMPLTPISFSKSAFSSCVKKPDRKSTRLNSSHRC